MFLSGAAKLHNIISEKDRLTIRDIVLDYYNNNRSAMNSEEGGEHYKKSFGMSGIPQIEPVFDALTRTIQDVTKLTLKKANSYSRIYLNQGRLRKHIDRPGLDLTLSVQIENTTGSQQPVFHQTYDGGEQVCDLNDGDGLLIKGQDLAHWRNDIETQEGNHLICVFFHWEIMVGEVLEHRNMLTPEQCTLIMADYERIGFNHSTIDRAGETLVDPHFRASMTQNLADTYGLRETVNAHYPMFRGMAFEGWQIVKYEEGGIFNAHNDCLADINARYFTILVYLNDDFTGGATMFNQTGDMIKPEQGKVIIWKNTLGPVCNPKSLHTGTKVKNGNKYIIVTWVRRPA